MSAANDRTGEVIELDYHPSPRQQVLHATTARQILYGGAAGGGKSHGMRWDAYAACLENPGLDAYLFRRTRGELENTHIKALFRELPQSLGRYNQTRNRWEFHNGSYLNMCYAEHETDVHNYNSVEFHWLGIDEAGQFTPYQIGYLKSRMRVGSFRPNQPALFPRLIMSANPGGVSHNYLKETFMDPAPPETLFHDKQMRNPNNPDDKGWSTIFIPAKIADNPHLDEGYDAAFGALPEWQQRMLREGDWNVVPGAYFDCWDARTHIIKPFAIPTHWTRFRSCDWGHATPFHIGWWAVSDGAPVNTRFGEVCYPEGALILYREWYGQSPHAKQRNTGLRIDGGEMAQRVKMMERREVDEGAEIRYGVADPSMWRADSGVSAAEKSALSGVPWRKADNQREAGWHELYSRIRGMDGVPMLYSFETCRVLNKTIPTLEADPKNPEDVLKQGEDHPGDSARYACMSRPYKQDAPERTRPIDAKPTFNDIMQEHLEGHRNKRRSRRFRMRHGS